MRFFTLFAACAAMFAVSSAAPATEGNTDVTAACFSELECSTFINHPVAERSVKDSLTNAQRFARGLPPKNPRRHFRPTGVQAARRQEPSGVITRGLVRVARADGTGDLGYLSSHPFSGAQHRYQDISNAMVVSFRSTGTSQSQIDIDTENSDIQSAFPRLSLVQGRDSANSDLTAGNFHYTYIGGSDATAPGASPQTVPNSYTAATGLARTAESAIWTYDPLTHLIAPQWINSDGNAASITVFTQGTAMYVGGDSGSFAARYPSPVVNVNLYFVPLDSTAAAPAAPVPTVD